MKQTKEQPQKALPYEWDGGWVGMQNEVLTIYTLHPEFKGNTLMVYAYLLKNFNREKGRSYPSYANMSRTLGIHEDTIETCIRTLSKLGMITVHAIGGPRRKRHEYTFKPLITTEATFIDRFPEAMPALEKRRAAERVAEEKRRQAEVEVIIEWD